MKWWVFIIAILFTGVGVWFLASKTGSNAIISPVVDKILERPLDKYTIENLGKREYKSQIFIDDQVSPDVFKFHFDSDGRKVTGLAHIPSKCPCPVIVQFRGYVEREIYKPGVGTQKSAQLFAQNGFISLAPDFLGYGGSDSPSTDVFEERFQSYTAALNLIAATDNWELSTGQLGLWGHSNGGQIALAILEISQKPYPTVLWAPVSKPFPYSILYYTDEADDKGKALRKKLANFEQNYDVDKYSMTNYLDRISAPLQLHQGASDEAVLQKWTDEFVQKLSTVNSQLSINYLVYPGADHNMLGAWDMVIKRDIQFFNKRLKSVVK